LQTLQNQAIDKIHEALDKAEKHYNITLPRPSISFDLKGKTAGRANMPLMEQNGDAFMNRTPVHEAAHLIVRKLHGQRRVNRRRVVKPHGPEWKSVMRVLGLEPSRCHKYDTTNCGGRRTRRKGKKYSYKCDCMDYSLGATRHRRNLSVGGHAYRCRKCKTVLVFQGTMAE